MAVRLIGSRTCRMKGWYRSGDGDVAAFGDRLALHEIE
jgi:hypothetical protein